MENIAKVLETLGARINDLELSLQLSRDCNKRLEKENAELKEKNDNLKDFIKSSKVGECE